MKNAPILIQDLKQLDNHRFSILWSDESMSQFRLSELQRRCPCARCQENLKQIQVLEEVRAYRICSVGNYAIRIEFTSGCSRGVFAFDLLREIDLKRSK